MPKTMTVPNELYAATDSLVQNLLAAEPFLAYQQAQSKLDADSQGRVLLERLAALQTGLRQQQNNGGVTQAEIAELRAVQAQVQANTAIMAYLQAQQAAANFLREINQEISPLLGVDFALLARQGCC